MDSDDDMLGEGGDEGDEDLLRPETDRLYAQFEEYSHEPPAHTSAAAATTATAAASAAAASATHDAVPPSTSGPAGAAGAGALPGFGAPGANMPAFTIQQLMQALAPMGGGAGASLDEMTAALRMAAAQASAGGAADNGAGGGVAVPLGAILGMFGLGNGAAPDAAPPVDVWPGYTIAWGIVELFAPVGMCSDIVASYAHH